MIMKTIKVIFIVMVLMYSSTGMAFDLGKMFDGKVVSSSPVKVKGLYIGMNMKDAAIVADDIVTPIMIESSASIGNDVKGNPIYTATTMKKRRSKITNSKIKYNSGFGFGNNDEVIEIIGDGEKVVFVQMWPDFVNNLFKSGALDLNHFKAEFENGYGVKFDNIQSTDGVIVYRYHNQGSSVYIMGSPSIGGKFFVILKKEELGKFD